MRLGEELTRVYNNNRMQTLYDKLKPVLIDLASQHMEGCILKFNNIKFDIIADLTRDLKDENVDIEQTNGIVFWGAGIDPCKLCSFSPKYACCGCKDAITYVEKRKNLKNL